MSAIMSKLLRLVGRVATASVLSLALPTLAGAAPHPSDPGFIRCPTDQVSRYPAWLVQVYVNYNKTGDPDMFYRTETINGSTVLLATGAIRDGESQRLSAALNRAGAVDEVWLVSPGGASDEGVKMGREIRARGLTTRIPAGQMCASACSVAFLGGLFRYVDPGAAYGIHMFSTSFREDALQDVGQTITTQSDGRARDAVDVAKILEDQINQANHTAARTTTVRSQYLIEMGVSTKWLEEWSQTDGKCMNFLSRSKLERFLVDNVVR